MRQRVQTLNLFLADVYGPQKVLKDGLIPPELVLGNANYRPEMQGLALPYGTYIHINGTDLVRDGAGPVPRARGQWPLAVGRVLRGREPPPDAARLLRPDARRAGAAGLRLWPPAAREAVRGGAAPSVLDPQVVLLSPGVFNSAYFEHVFLAREMGVPLVEGRDLVVENDRVYMRTVAGPVRGRRDLPPAQRRFPRPRGVQPGQHAGRAGADACLPQGHGGAGQCDRHRRRRRQGGLRLRAAADPLLSRPGPDHRQCRDPDLPRAGRAGLHAGRTWPSWWSSRSANRAATASPSGRAPPRARSRWPASACWPIPPTTSASR